MIVKDRSGKYVGLLTDKVFFEALASGVVLVGMRVCDLKLEPLICVNKNAGIEEVMMKFRETPSGRLAMVDDEGRIVGILKKKNIDRFSIFKTAIKKVLRQ